MNFRLSLLPFSLVYSGIAQFRNLLFNTGVFKQKEFKVPVILVGNLSVGGTGKTPHVEFLIRLLRNDYRIATLSRGYGRKSNGFVVAGKGVSTDVIGDEPMQYYSKFEDITVSVCEKRAEGIEKLLVSEKRPQVIIMDDGFQHRHVNPGFKILLTSVDKLFTRDFVLPAGDLREPRSAYHRADCIIVTRTEVGMSKTEKDAITAEINPDPDQQLYFSSLVYDNPVHFYSATKISLTDLQARPVLLFTGIANPAHLENFLKEKTSRLETVRFPDHHEYTLNDIVALKQKFNKFTGLSPIVLTTEKDFQRLRNKDFMKELDSLPCYFIPVKIQIDQEEAFTHTIRNYVKTNTGNS